MKQHLCYVLNHNVLSETQTYISRRKMPVESHVELGSSICTAFNSHPHLNSYRLSQNKDNAEFKTFEASATEGASIQCSMQNWCSLQKQHLCLQND